MSQSEQGYRYLYKSNYNSLLYINKNIKTLSNYFWLDKKDIKNLIKKKKIFNMDTISVFSTFIEKNKLDTPLNSMNKIFKWILNKDNLYNLSIKESL